MLVGLDGPALIRALIAWHRDASAGRPGGGRRRVDRRPPESGVVGRAIAHAARGAVVIFGAAATEVDPGGALKLEAAVALLTLAGAPFVTGAAIRASRT